jgi:signal transduction histidine kinase
MSELLLETRLDGQRRELLQSLHQSARNLKMLVDDVLDLSRLDAGRVELVLGECRPRQLIGEITTEFTPRFAAKGLHLDVVVDPDLPRELVADAFRIRQVLVNLLGNALKFTANGSVVLACQIDEGGRFRLSVADQGIGIGPEDLARLFTPFQQASAAISHHYGGTGLGLAISKRLVQLMGGEIGVASTPGKGSTFWFTVPVVRPDRDAGYR